MAKKIATIDFSLMVPQLEQIRRVAVPTSFELALLNGCHGEVVAFAETTVELALPLIDGDLMRCTFATGHTVPIGANWSYPGRLWPARLQAHYRPISRRSWR